VLKLNNKAHVSDEGEEQANADKPWLEDSEISTELGLDSEPCDETSDNEEEQPSVVDHWTRDIEKGTWTILHVLPRRRMYVPEKRY
jgi:hypothetical protein